MTIARRGALTLLASCALIAAASAPASATAREGRAGRSDIEVFPGPHAIRTALADAHAGDIFLIHAGTYGDHVTVSTPNITLQPYGDGPVVVDGGCNAQYTIRVRADNVVIAGLQVQGATEGFGPYPAEIDYVLVDGGQASFNTLVDTCDAEYGINVYSSTQILLIRNTASGFSDAGIYIGGINGVATFPVRAVKNTLFGNNRGIIVEDSSPPNLVIARNDVHDNLSAGIHLTNSDNIKIVDNIVKGNGAAGIELDANSDNNSVKRNTASGQTYDLANLGGSGNCFQLNRYHTSTGTIAC